MLAARADRPDVATNTLAVLPDGMLPRLLSGEILLRRAAGNWSGDDDARLSLRPDAMTLAVSGRRIVGPVGMFADELVVLGSSGAISQRYPMQLNDAADNLELRISPGKTLNFRRSN